MKVAFHPLVIACVNIIRSDISFVCVCVCVCGVRAPRSPTWRMILTGTQLSSTTGKDLCQKTTSTCGHMRKYIHTHTHTQAHASSWMRFTRSSTGLSKQLISERLQLGGVSLLSSGHLHAGIRQPTQRDTLTRLPYVITHDTAVCVCVCVCVFTVELLVHPVSLSDGPAPAGFYFFPLWQNPNLTTQPFRTAPAR